MAHVYPPSPALSACDSLADIDDLEAFLEAQGHLSHWPTPPSATKKEHTIVHEFECGRREDEDDDDGDDELYWIASALTDLATLDSNTRASDVELVLGVLLRAAFPPEVLAITYNILKAVAASTEQRLDSDRHPTPDLLVTASLSLATMFTSDRPPCSDYWARVVCRRTWTARRIDTTVLQLLLETAGAVRMLALSSPSAVERALRELCEITDSPASAGPVEYPGATEHEAPAALKLAISNSSTQWVNGELTPADTPHVESNTWLPLL